MNRLSLRTKLLLLVLGTVVGMALVLLGAISMLANLETNRTIRRDVRATGSMLSQRMHERSVALTDECLLLAEQPRLKYLRGANAETIADSVSEWLSQMHADAALVTDQDGHLLGATDRGDVDGRDCRADPGIATALRGEVYQGVVVRGNRLMLAVSVPVEDGVSKVVLMTFTAYSAIDSGVAADLKQAQGSDVVFLYRQKVMGASLSLSDPLPRLGSAPKLIQVGGVRYYALYAPLPHSALSDGMGFVTLCSYDRAIAPYYRFQITLAVILLLALLLALAASSVVARSLTRPLDGIMQAAIALSQGQWPDHFEVRRSDEIGLLQRVFNDMTSALRSSQERLLALIDTDPLTGLANHRRFQERLAQEVRRCAASGEALSLLLLDLDHFQEYNRRNGHAAGDAALIKIALLLRNCLPEVAVLARYGGEEFVALLPQQRLEDAEAIAEQIRSLVLTTCADKEVGAALTLSVGCATLGAHTRHAEGLALAAELAVSRAKQLGRNRVCRFDSIAGDDPNADPYQLYRSLKDGSLATIQALAAAVDAKDPYTRGHSQRVAEYAAALARQIGLSQSEVDLVYTTGTLHDVGKIGVPDGILKKTGRLDDEERAIMETHPVLGEVIVRKVPQLAQSLPGVRHHHERWDGRGYPDGLAGETIPPLARLLAIADTFDAMTSDRPYRKGMPAEVALQEIASGAGTQFDPDLAPRFVTMMQSSHVSAKAA